MKLATASWSFRGTSLERQLFTTCLLGLDAIELGIAEHGNSPLQSAATPQSIEDIRVLLNRYAIIPTHAATRNDFTCADENAVIADLEKVKAVIEITKKLHIRFLRIFTGFSPTEDIPVNSERWKRMISCLNAAAECAAKCNVILTVETHGSIRCASIPGSVVHSHGPSTHPELLKKWLAEADPYLRILYNPANLAAVGMGTDQIITLYNTLRPRIASMRLKDFRPASDTNDNDSSAIVPCAVGEGSLGNQRLHQAFANYGGTGIIEYELTTNTEDGLRRSLAVLRE